MKYSSELFELICSMTMAEKKYFKLWASTHSKKEKDDYVKLFDAIAVQKKYDEKSMRLRFAGKGLVRHLARKKHYLYHAILRSMQAYRSGITMNAKARILYCGAEYLAEKGLWKQAEKLLHKVVKFCEKHEQFPLLLEAGNLKQELILHQMYQSPARAEDEMRLHYSAVCDTLNRIKNSHEYWKLNMQFIAMESTVFMPRNPSQKKKYNALAKSSLLQNKNLALSKSAMLYYYQTLGLKAILNNDYMSFSKCQEEILRLYENEPEVHKEKFSKYTSALLNNAIAYMRTGQYTKALDMLNKVHLLKVPDSGRKADLLIRHLTLRLELIITEGRFEEGIRLINNVKNELTELLSDIRDISFLAVIYFYCAYIYMGAGQFRKSLAWLNRFFSEIGQEIRPDVHPFACILNLIVHYELGNTDLLPYVTRSTYRFLLKRERLYKVEILILDFIRKKIPDMNSRASRIKGFKALRVALFPLANDPFEKAAFEYFDFISWLESKIENRQFAEVVKEKITNTT